MIKLASLLKTIKSHKRIQRITEDKYDSVDKWDNWLDYLKEDGYGIDIVIIKQLIKKFNINIKGYFKHKILRIWDEKQVAYLYNDDTENVEYMYVEDIKEFIDLFDVDNADELGIDPEKIYNPWIESSLYDLKRNPGIVYHWTTKEKWEEIQKSGKILQSNGTSLTNQNYRGIFTTYNPEEYDTGIYGNICLEINLNAFMESVGYAFLTLEFEPETTEYLLKDYIYRGLDLTGEVHFPNSDGVSPYTIIVGHNIPIKFIKPI
ncbi:MAG TPA: hypothetical protein PL028_01805 [Bacteroidales bacterium]|nr:hypothetical protein [Bacteroidales bacterium]